MAEERRDVSDQEYRHAMIGTLRTIGVLLFVLVVVGVLSFFELKQLTDAL